VGNWKKHPRKELEAVLEELAEHGWTIIDPPKYYSVRCPCGDHQRQVHLTPRKKHHGNNVLQWARNLPCWKEES
jgi:transposase